MVTYTSWQRDPAAIGVLAATFLVWRLADCPDVIQRGNAQSSYREPTMATGSYLSMTRGGLRVSNVLSAILP